MLGDLYNAVFQSELLCKESRFCIGELLAIPVLTNDGVVYSLTEVRAKFLPTNILESPQVSQRYLAGWRLGQEQCEEGNPASLRKFLGLGEGRNLIPTFPRGNTLNVHKLMRYNVLRQFRLGSRPN